jgi:hypothetical protein
LSGESSLEAAAAGAAAAGSPAAGAPSTATASATAAAAAATTAAALLGLVHHDLAAAEVLAVQGRDRRLRLRFVPHLHERESARSSGVPIGDDLDLVHFAALGPEEITELILAGRKRKISNKKPIPHDPLPVSGFESPVPWRH